MYVNCTVHSARMCLIAEPAAVEGSTGVHCRLFMEGRGQGGDEFDWLRQRHGVCTFAARLLLGHVFAYG